MQARMKEGWGQRDTERHWKTLRAGKRGRAKKWKDSWWKDHSIPWLYTWTSGQLRLVIKDHTDQRTHRERGHIMQLLNCFCNWIQSQVKMDEVEKVLVREEERESKRKELVFDYSLAKSVSSLNGPWKKRRERSQGEEKERNERTVTTFDVTKMSWTLNWLVMAIWSSRVSSANCRDRTLPSNESWKCTFRVLSYSVSSGHFFPCFMCVTL